MAFIVVENLRGFFNSRPPLVVFMICLGSFAISLITFAYIVKVKDIKDPDIVQDWNSFLDKFSGLELCVSQNNSLNATEGRLSVVDQAPASVIKDIPKKLSHTLGFPQDDSKGKDFVSRIVRRAVAHQDGLISSRQSSSTGVDQLSVPSSATTLTQERQKSHLENVTVHLVFRVEPNMDFQSMPLNLVQFVGSMHPNSLSVDHKGIDKEKIFVTLAFPQNLSSSQCEEMVGGACVLYRVDACVTFSAPAYLLPNTRTPEQDMCKAPGESTLDFSVRNMSIGTLSDTSQPHWCEHGARLTAEFTLDDSLTMFLSLHDKSMINLHLMRTSYFLFVMVLTLFCYAMVKGRPAKVKTVHVTYDKLSVSSQP